MSLLKRIKEASSLADVAFILGFSPQSLAFVLYKIPDNEKYLSFKIPKKNGGDREISAPEPRLKNLQRRLANVLNACSAELDKEKNKKNLAHGFKKKFSIHTNANLHKNRRFVLNFDLQDFFPTINFGRVRGYFIRNRDFELHPKVATIFAQIACHKNELPQGSPCSPVISNFIAHLLDVRLVQCAKQYGCSYTRYADDITFSTNQKVFPEKIAFQATNAQKVWCLGRMVEEQVKRSGFQINQGKTRMRHYDIRQVVTGLVVNKKVNVRSEYYKLARAMSHSLFKTGKYSIPGYLSPVDIIEHDLKRSHETELSRLEGILNYIHYTRDLSDLRDLEEKQGTLTSTTIWKLFKRFLFFKNFGWLDKPVVICEGITDSIYLKLALKRLWVSFPALIERVDNNFVYKIRFLRRSKNVREVLKLSGGTGELSSFIGTFSKMAKSYPAWSSMHPVILLTDNDEGAKCVFSSVNQNSIVKPKKTPSIDRDEDYFYINNNLYFVKTPHFKGKKETCIEDLFEDKWRAVKIDGKKFSIENNCDQQKFYGKHDFAEKVIAKNFNVVNFDGFKPLLERFVAIINKNNSP